MVRSVLDGNFAPVRGELTVAELAVTGRIPAHLDGRYLRNGPNPVTEPNPDAYHWFLGTGMVHAVRIRNGQAEWYRNRFVRDESTSKVLGEPHRAGVKHDGMDFSANTNVLEHAGRTLALVEGGSLPYELGAELDTIAPCDFDGTLSGGYTAHPKVDPISGELHAISYYWAAGGRVQYTVVGVDGRVRRTTEIPVGGSPMMHDFSLTEHYVVLYDLPVTFDPKMAARTAPRLLRKPFELFFAHAVGRRPLPRRLATRINGASGPVLPYSWTPDRPARVGVMAREGTAKDLRWFDVDPCYVFHSLNAYEDGTRVVLDVVRHPQMFATHRLEPREGSAALERWTVDTASGKVNEERVDDRHQEFPRFDERVLGRRHRYSYTIAHVGRTPAVDDLAYNSVLRHDMSKGTTQARSFGAGQGVGEFVFVPNGAGSAEDDGVLMGLVYHAATDRSDLELLDAQTLETLATIHVPARVPYGFHGNWAPSGAAR